MGETIYEKLFEKMESNQFGKTNHCGIDNWYYPGLNDS